jgi:hypothetical protein
MLNLSTFGRCCALLAFLGMASSGVFADDLRTWTDVTGKFKIKAKFISEANGTVTLEQEDGDELEIELRKLSAADQRVVADLKKQADDSPFKAKSASPFTSKSKTAAKTGTGTRPATADNAPAGETRNVQVDWLSAETISLSPAESEWKVEVAEVEEALARPKTVTLPAKSNFFEGLKGLAVNPAAKKAVAGYNLGEPKPQGTTRVVICDLEAGRAGTAAVTPGLMVPVALHDDGRQIVMRREEFGFGNHDRLEVWTLKGQRVEKTVSWIPYDNRRGGERDVQWAEFLDADHLATSANGDIAVWKFPEIELEYHLPAGGGGRPALSPDRKRIAFSDGKNVGIFDVEQRAVIAQQATPMSLHAPQLAFSPSGKRLACISQDKLLVWDVANGNLIQNMTVTGVHIFTGIDFPHDNYVLGGNKFLIDIENQLKLWTYEGHEQVLTAGGWTFFGVMDGQKAAALVPVKLPHSAATDLLKKALTDPTLFVLKAGTKVKLDLSGIPDASQRDAVTKGLTKQLGEIQCTVDPNGTVTLAAALEGPKQREISFIASGDYKMQEYIARVRFLYEGKPIWERANSNVPFMVHLSRGENIESHLRKLEKPDYTFFERVELPKFLQKPAAGSSQSGSLTLGTSKLTTAGLR